MDVGAGPHGGPPRERQSSTFVRADSDGYDGGMTTPDDVPPAAPVDTPPAPEAGVTDGRRGEAARGRSRLTRRLADVLLIAGGLVLAYPLLVGRVRAGAAGPARLRLRAAVGVVRAARDRLTPGGPCHAPSGAPSTGSRSCTAAGFTAGDPVGRLKMPAHRRQPPRPARRERTRALDPDGDRALLRNGPVHYAVTPLPGAGEPFAVAGHRTTYGAPFNKLDRAPARRPYLRGHSLRPLPVRGREDDASCSPTTSGCSPTAATPGAHHVHARSTAPATGSSCGRSWSAPTRRSDAAGATSGLSRRPWAPAATAALVAVGTAAAPRSLPCSSCTTADSRARLAAGCSRPDEGEAVRPGPSSGGCAEPCGPVVVNPQPSPTQHRRQRRASVRSRVRLTGSERRRPRRTDDRCRAGPAAPGGPAARSSSKLTMEATGLPGAPKTSVVASRAEGQRLARLGRDAPEAPLDAELVLHLLDEVPLAHRHAARRDDDVVLERGGDQAPRLRPGRRGRCRAAPARRRPPAPGHRR